MAFSLDKYIPDDIQLSDIELNSLLGLINNLGVGGLAVRTRGSLKVIPFSELREISLQSPQMVILEFLEEAEVILQYPTDQCAELAKTIIADLWLKTYGIVDDAKPMPSPSAYFIGEDAEPYSEKDLQFFSEVEDEVDEKKFSYIDNTVAHGTVVYVRWKDVNVVAYHENTVFINDHQIPFQTESAAIAFHAWVTECVDYYG
ncbi:hypothetical protein MOC16_gp249 [Klebsiella phage vB_KpM_FBKp24]|uniref:Uncharacterized protein n=1 Tax=Klebsiella phage vB_KpM_FBKp24 TaxID=2801834 RepID=A0A7U0GBF4_9CAUD|nr:hypothetical protein MOC16_gp249 [Klebsiella phage vB_KpM_FBKp24]QQV92134.1 hypothetical protein vBKpMFBKp24_164 [Klebsiella phage vB_KpM_FBKp24]